MISTCIKPVLKIQLYCWAVISGSQKCSLGWCFFTQYTVLYFWRPSDRFCASTFTTIRRCFQPYTDPFGMWFFRLRASGICFNTGGRRWSRVALRRRGPRAPRWARTWRQPVWVVNCVGGWVVGARECPRRLVLAACAIVRAHSLARSSIRAKEVSEPKTVLPQITQLMLRQLLLILPPLLRLPAHESILQFLGIMAPSITRWLLRSDSQTMWGKIAYSYFCTLYFNLGWCAHASILQTMSLINRRLNCSLHLSLWEQLKSWAVSAAIPRERLTQLLMREDMVSRSREDTRMRRKKRIISRPRNDDETCSGVGGLKAMCCVMLTRWTRLAEKKKSVHFRWKRIEQTVGWLNDSLNNVVQLYLLSNWDIIYIHPKNMWLEGWKGHPIPMYNPLPITSPIFILFRIWYPRTYQNLITKRWRTYMFSSRRRQVLRHVLRYATYLLAEIVGCNDTSQVRTFSCCSGNVKGTVPEIDW